MAFDQLLRAVLTAEDKTAAIFHQAGTRADALGAQFRHIGDRARVLGEETGLTDIAEHAKTALGHVKGLVSGVLELGGALVGLTGIASVGGLLEWVKGTAEFEGALYDQSIKAGIAGQQLAGWQYAAKLAHVDLEQLNRGLVYLNKNIDFAATGKARDVAAILGKMGFHNAQGHLVPTAEALKAVSAEVKQLVDSGQIQLATAALSKLFGARSGAQLLPLFAQGPDKIAAQIKEAIELGVAPSNEHIKAGKEFDDNLKAMTASVEGLKFALGNGLFPALKDTVTEFTEWLKLNHEWLALEIGDAVRDLATWLKSIDWSAVKRGFWDLVDAAKWVIGEIGGVRNAILAVVAISLAPTIAAFWGLAASVASAAASFIIIPLAGFIATLGSLVPAIDSAAAAMVAFDLAVDSNPIGAIVAAIGLLIGAAILLYEYWQPISTWFENMWATAPSSSISVPAPICWSRFARFPRPRSTIWPLLISTARA